MSGSYSVCKAKLLNGPQSHMCQSCVCKCGKGASVHTLEGVPFVGMLPSKQHHSLQSPETHVGDTCMCISTLNTHCPEQGKQRFNDEAHIPVQYM